MRQVRLALLLLSASVVPGIHSQQTPAAPTLRVNAREVLVDIVVTDNHGNPVTGLPASAFHVFDKNRPQTINSFLEHRGGVPSAQPSTESGGQSAVRPVQNVILIDTSRMDVVLQMMLYKDLTRFVRSLPPGASLAVFWRSYAAPVMLQNFTADHALLEAAITKAIPHLQKFKAAQNAPEANDVIGPEMVAQYLSQVPGRKNLLWFIGGTSGGGSIALASMGISAGPSEVSSNLRRVDEELQTARMSVYPIDVRGLEPAVDSTLTSQHLRESSIADETGGKAFYNTNDMALAAQHAISDGENFYAISFSPDDLRGDGSWHPLRVEVDGGSYALSYRRGYFDDNASAKDMTRPSTAMISVKDKGIAQPDAYSIPLNFSAKALPTLPPEDVRPKRGMRFVKIHYDLPIREVQHGFTDGVGSAEVGAAVVVFNQDGWVVSHVSQKVTLKFAESVYKKTPNGALPFDQFIQIPAEDPAFLYIAVWDADSGRMGTVDLTLNPRKHKQK